MQGDRLYEECGVGLNPRLLVNHYSFKGFRFQSKHFLFTHPSLPLLSRNFALVQSQYLGLTGQLTCVFLFILREHTTVFIIQNAAIKHSVMLATAFNYLIKDLSCTSPATCLYYSCTWHNVGKCADEGGKKKQKVSYYMLLVKICCQARGALFLRLLY